MPASPKESKTRPRLGGLTYPSVNSDDPLVTQASVHGRIPVAQKIPANPVNTLTTHNPGRSSSAVGAYIDITRSRNSNDRRGEAMRSNTRRRRAMNRNLVSNADAARGFWRKYAFNYLPVELISSVYETLLGDSNDVVYTPNFLVNTLLDDSNCIPLSNYDQTDFKVIDVSCGSGIFLVSAFKRFVQRWRYKQYVETGKLVHPTADVMLSLIKNNIFGVDIKEGAVRLTVFSLCLALCDELTPKEIWTELKFDDTFQTNFIHQNFFAFLNDAPTSHWDLVVGNPPFIELKTKSAAYQEILKLNKEVAQKAKKKVYPQNQIALMFLDQAQHLVKENGIICLIMPSAPLLYNNSDAFKNDFFPRHQVLQILDFHKPRFNTFW